MKHPSPSATKVKRDSALARPELREQTPYIDVRERLPDIGKPVTGYANDGQGIYRLPFPIVLRNHCTRGDCSHDWKGPCAHRPCGALIEGNWCNAKSEHALEVKIVGWLHA